MLKKKKMIMIKVLQKNRLNFILCFVFILLFSKCNNRIIKDTATIKIIKWQTTEDVNWNNYDVADIKFKCEFILVTREKYVKKLQRTFSKKQLLFGKLGKSGHIQYSIFFNDGSTDYRIRNDGFFIYKNKNYVKKIGVLSYLDFLFTQYTVAECKCPGS